MYQRTRASDQGRRLFMSQSFYIGLMSGTSIDAMDGVLASFDGVRPQILASSSRQWTAHEREILNILSSPDPCDPDLIYKSALDISKAELEVVKSLLEKAKLKPQEVTAIGAHGQTVRHRPDLGYTVQLSAPSYLAINSGIDVVSHFREADLASGGEGAPLTPAFHSYLLGSKSEPQYVLNLGGIANLTVMGTGGTVLEGYDTGPSNTLLDLASRTFLNVPYDKDAKTALKGRVNTAWLGRLLDNPYFKKDPPKSTGRELFNRGYVESLFSEVYSRPELIPDLMATLCEFTVVSICDALENSMRRQTLAGGTLITCGGGSSNPLIRQGLCENCADMGVEVKDCSEFGVDARFLEPLCFAWMSRLFVEGRRLPLGGASKAQSDTIAGSLSPAPDGWFETLRAAKSPAEEAPLP